MIQSKLYEVEVVEEAFLEIQQKYVMIMCTVKCLKRTTTKEVASFFSITDVIDSMQIFACTYFVSQV